MPARHERQPQHGLPSKFHAPMLPCAHTHALAPSHTLMAKRSEVAAIRHRRHCLHRHCCRRLAVYISRRRNIRLIRLECRLRMRAIKIIRAHLRRGMSTASHTSTVRCVRAVAVVHWSLRLDAVVQPSARSSARAGASPGCASACAFASRAAAPSRWTRQRSQVPYRSRTVTIRYH